MPAPKELPGPLHSDDGGASLPRGRRYHPCAVFRLVAQTKGYTVGLMAYGALFSTKLIADGRYQEALEAATGEIAATPDDPEPYFNRGRAAAGLEGWPAAVEDYARALERDAAASAVDPSEIDDELFFALRQWAVAERQQKSGSATAADDGALRGALAVLDRYLTLCPGGRHLGDLETWRNHLRGVATVWVRERA